jgi:chorismate mutase
MDISDWRKKIDAIDRMLVDVLNQRASVVIEIGRLKRQRSMPIYEPAREQEVLAHVHSCSQGPLGPRDLSQIYERIIDIMRSIEKHEIVPGQTPEPHSTELDSKLED